MKKFKQALPFTFSQIPSPFASVEVRSDSIVCRGGDTPGHILPINSSTRMSTSGWGYVCVDVNCNYAEANGQPFQEKVYPRVIDHQGFMQAIRDAIVKQ